MSSRPEGIHSGAELDHAELLRHAAEQVTEFGLEEVLIVDVDYHHVEQNVWSEVLEYVDNDVLRYMFDSEDGFVLPGQIELPGQEAGRRIRPQQAWEEGHDALEGLTGAQRDVEMARETMRLMGTDYVSVFPTYLLDIGTNPHPHFEVPLLKAWSRWLVERVLPEEPRIVSMLPLPFNDPDASLEVVEEFGDFPGVVGFMVTSVRYERSYEKQYFKLYRAMEERGLPIGFHSGYTMRDRVSHFNKFISVHSIGFPLFQMIQVTNWVLNGVPELFPNLKALFIEGGLAWVPFLAQRLDHEYVMRPSEAPLLKRKPSEYLGDLFYSTQPLEAELLPLLEETFKLLNAPTQLMYASDWPHWDWDPPSRIMRLPFLDEQAKLNILGENAKTFYGERLPDLSKVWQKKG